LHRMQSRQVLSERNLLRADLRDPVLLPIAQMLLENNSEYLYNCVCQAFPILVLEFYGHMIVTQDDDRGLIMQTMVKGQTRPPTYQFCDWGPCSANLRSFVS
jgi:hypothetical protein